MQLLPHVNATMGRQTVWHAFVTCGMTLRPAAGPSLTKTMEIVRELRKGKTVASKNVVTVNEDLEGVGNTYATHD